MDILNDGGGSVGSTLGGIEIAVESCDPGYYYNRITGICEVEESICDSPLTKIADIVGEGIQKVGKGLPLFTKFNTLPNNQSSVRSLDGDGSIH